MAEKRQEGKRRSRWRTAAAWAALILAVALICAKAASDAGRRTGGRESAVSEDISSQTEQQEVTAGEEEKEESWTQSPAEKAGESEENEPQERRREEVTPSRKESEGTDERAAEDQPEEDGARQDSGAVPDEGGVPGGEPPKDEEQGEQDLQDTGPADPFTAAERAAAAISEFLTRGDGEKEGMGYFTFSFPQTADEDQMAGALTEVMRQEKELFSCERFDIAFSGIVSGRYVFRCYRA